MQTKGKFGGAGILPVYRHVECLPHQIEILSSRTSTCPGRVERLFHAIARHRVYGGPCHESVGPPVPHRAAASAGAPCSRASSTCRFGKRRNSPRRPTCVETNPISATCQGSPSS